MIRNAFQAEETMWPKAQRHEIYIYIFFYQYYRFIAENGKIHRDTHDKVHINKRPRRQAREFGIILVTVESYRMGLIIKVTITRFA